MTDTRIRLIRGHGFAESLREAEALVAAGKVVALVVVTITVDQQVFTTVDTEDTCHPYGLLGALDHAKYLVRDALIEK